MAFAGLALPLLSGAGKILGSLFAQHSLRLKDAQTENEMADQAIPAFDQDLQEIITAWNSGQYDAETIAQSFLQLDANMKKYLSSMNGKPGVAWHEYSAPPAQPCNKGCTVGCCLYYVNIHTYTVGMAAFVLGQAIQPHQYGEGIATGQTSGVKQVTVGQVYPSKYSSYTRPAYTVQLRAPGNAPTGTLASAVDSITSALSGGGSIAPAASSAIVKASLVSSTAALSPAAPMKPSGTLIALILGAAALFALILVRR